MDQTIRFPCPRCRAVIGAPQAAAGDARHCPGCGEAITVPAQSDPSLDPLAAAAASRSANSTNPTKPCPYCREEIRAAAVKCRHCGEYLTADARAQSLAGPATCEFCGDAETHQLTSYYDLVACTRCQASLAGRRAIAFLIDQTLLSMVGGIGVATLFFAALVAIERGEFPALAVGIFVALFFGLNVLFLIRDALFVGKSPGRLLIGTRVVDATTGDPVTYGQSIKRNLPHLIPLVTCVIAYQVLVGDHPRVGETWANTMVVP